MPIDRVPLFDGAAALATSLSAYGLDAAQFGVRPGAPDDQSRALQRAIDAAARRETPLVLAPGVYRAGNLRLPSGAQVTGVTGATRLILAQEQSLFCSEHADMVSLTGLTLDGGRRPLPGGRGLVHMSATTGLHIAECIIIGAGGHAIALEDCDGDVTRNAISGTADMALVSIDGRGIAITGNTISNSGNGGIRIGQNETRHDGSLIADNAIENTSARSGATGDIGNAVIVIGAADVILRNNQIDKAAGSAIRCLAAANVQITGNHCSALGAVAIRSALDGETALIADNVIDEAASGIAVTRFDGGGRHATVRNNTMRNLCARVTSDHADSDGVGISVDADTTVAGNTIEHAEEIGILVGRGGHLRAITVQRNLVRHCGIGIAVSVVAGAGAATITRNVLTGSQRGAIVGMHGRKPVTGDLSLAGAELHPQLTIGGNTVT